MKNLCGDLNGLNLFRNTRVVHVETILDNAEEAWDAMVGWFRCLNRMSKVPG